MSEAVMMFIEMAVQNREINVIVCLRTADIE